MHTNLLCFRLRWRREEISRVIFAGEDNCCHIYIREAEFSPATLPELGISRWGPSRNFTRNSWSLVWSSLPFAGKRKAGSSGSENRWLEHPPPPPTHTLCEERYHWLQRSGNSRVLPTASIVKWFLEREVSRFNPKPIVIAQNYNYFCQVGSQREVAYLSAILD